MKRFGFLTLAIVALALLVGNTTKWEKRGTYINAIRQNSVDASPVYYHSDQTSMQATDAGFFVMKWFCHNVTSGRTTIRVYSTDFGAGRTYEDYTIPAGSTVHLRGFRISGYQVTAKGAGWNYIYGEN